MCPDVFACLIKHRLAVTRPCFELWLSGSAAPISSLTQQPARPSGIGEVGGCTPNPTAASTVQADELLAHPFFGSQAGGGKPPLSPAPDGSLRARFMEPSGDDSTLHTA